MSATSLATTCKACNITSGGMINIYEHPNNLDSMYRYVSGIEQVRKLYYLFFSKVYADKSYNFR